MDREAVGYGAEEVGVLVRKGRCMARRDEREGLEEDGFAATRSAVHEHVGRVDRAGAKRAVVVVISTFGGEQVCLGGVVVVRAAARGAPRMLGLESGEVRLIGLELVGVEIGGGKAGSDFAEFFVLALDRTVGMESGGDEELDKVERAEASTVVVPLDVAEDGDAAQPPSQGIAVAGVDRI